MANHQSLVRVHVNIDISAQSLQAVVANTKDLARTGKTKRPSMDTSDVLASLISTFLAEKDFDAFAKDIDNY